MQTKLPDGLIRYGGTADFTEETVPAKLTSVHDTKPGVWGKLIVKEGVLDYIIPGPPEEQLRVCAGGFAVIEPQVKHYVRPVGAVRFHVDFYRRQK
ncbi:DUF1971 domain-containing protein [Hyphococcus flavus]|uniref:DUF1971 domain-containing protein n=1 Tax=Hyphococcus flavus TaxID=1866326 RepID=A0AAE9ZB52_9PROT|nr:DUF1971 domain-containing protein [Hyphococcus flavus]WDI31268.1 DUF1971 domain-containing protein [Hyphococcus flavus]